MRRAAPLLVVCAVHAAPLAWLAGQLSAEPQPLQLAMPSMTGVLVATEAPAPSVAAAAPPQPVPPDPVESPAVPDVAPPAKTSPPLPTTPTAAAAAATERAPAQPEPEPEPEPAPDSAPTPPPTDIARADPDSIPTTAEDAATRSPPPVQPPQTDAAHIHNRPPVYPPASRRLREEDRVLLDVLVAADGSVTDVRLKQSSGFPRLDDAALAAVQHWHYRPARRGGEPVAFWYEQPVDFLLNP